MLPLALQGVTKRGSSAFVEGNSQAPLRTFATCPVNPGGVSDDKHLQTKQSIKAFLLVFSHFHQRAGAHFPASVDLEAAWTSTCWQSPTILNQLRAFCPSLCPLYGVYLCRFPCLLGLWLCRSSMLTWGQWNVDCRSLPGWIWTLHEDQRPTLASSGMTPRHNLELYNLT